ncbi:uncharacterized protein METZ01_LOCUS211233 [marine metagenome]|jgi:hypothetical protein|uniref:Protein NO VEIN C-terminal domain-containing protein n=1 Tax=marine metagenome TaxID=408172 RepID=A0A382F6U0_9ZZZZ
MALRERQLWKKLKNATPSISWTRLENWALFGTPDLLGYASSGNFFTVELKSTTLKNPNFVRFSPHQISFHIKHKKNTFVLVACALDQLVRLYPGSGILELVDSGLKLEPLACGLPACARVLEGL